MLSTRMPVSASRMVARAPLSLIRSSIAAIPPSSAQSGSSVRSDVLDAMYGYASHSTSSFSARAASISASASREAHCGDPQRAVTDEVRDVQREPAGVESVEIVAERAPREVHARRHVEREAAQVIDELGGDGRRREAAVADDFGGHTLADL